jgi:hypothetical protein
MKGLSKFANDEEDNEERGQKRTSYYLQRLNLIYEEKSRKAGLWDDMDEDERLVFMARLMRILQSEEDIPVGTFIDKVLFEIKTLEENIREAIRDLARAGLVAIEDGKLKLTNAGKELLSVS